MNTSLRTLLAACCLLTLTACGTPVSRDLQARLENPLFAERYSEELLDALSDVYIREEPVLKNETKKANIEQALTYWRAVAAEARIKEQKGLIGSLTSVLEDTSGHVLLDEKTLWFGTNFLGTPGINLRVMLSTGVDPREGEFPDESALDLGQLQSPYGDQSFLLPEMKVPWDSYRTVVLWDSSSGRLHGFAQLNALP